MQALKVMEQTVQDAPDQQVSLTDPDARSMATSGKGTATVGYNVQIAVDAEHHLIVAHEVTRVRTQFAHHVMAAAIRTPARKFLASLSYRVAMRRKSLSRQNIRSMRLRLL